MAGAGGFPSLVSVLGHVREFASFLECDLLSFIAFIFHVMLTQKDTRLKRYLKSTSWQQQSPCLQCSGKCLKNTCSFERSGFLRGQNLFEQHP